MREQNRKTVLVTGSTDGVGRLVAIRLGEAGARVLAHGRNTQRGALVVSEIEAAGGTAEFIAADLSALAEVRRLAEAVRARTDRLDILINNAGIGRSGATRQTSADGHELRFAVNYLAGFPLTQLLLPLIKQSAPARIVNVASAGQQPLDFADIMLTRGYGGTRAYCQSKLAQILFTIDLARERAGFGRHGQRPASGDLHGHDHGAPVRCQALGALSKRAPRRSSILPCHPRSKGAAGCISTACGKAGPMRRPMMRMRVNASRRSAWN